MITIFIDFLSYLTPYYLTLYLTLSLVREQSNAVRLLFSGAIWAFYLLIKENLTHPTLLLEVIIVLITILVSKRDFTILEFIKIVTIYLVVTLISRAFRSLLVSLLTPNETLLSIILSASIILTAFTVKVLYFLTNEPKKPKRTYLIEFYNNGKSYKTKGYLDTGNMLYDMGKPVVIISTKISTELGLMGEKDIAVSTISGLTLLKGGRTTIKIFLDKKSHKVMPIVYAISDKMISRGYEVLLHKDMERI